MNLTCYVTTVTHQIKSGLPFSINLIFFFPHIINKRKRIEVLLLTYLVVWPRFVPRLSRVTRVQNKPISPQKCSSQNSSESPCYHISNIISVGSYPDFQGMFSLQTLCVQHKIYMCDHVTCIVVVVQYYRSAYWNTMELPSTTQNEQNLVN